jgi:HSP20 family protein
MLARWDPIRELNAVERDLLRLFGRVFREPAAERMSAFAPSVEAFYRDGHLVVRAELAGVDSKDVDVSVTGRTLTIKGRRQQPSVPADDRIFSEIQYGEFEWAMTLPEGLDPEHIKATSRDGILEITIPVSEAVRPKKVPVEIART